MNLEFLIKEIFSLSKQGQNSQATAAKKLKELGERIKKGESTGDKIKDFVISLGAISEDYEKPYRKMEARLKNKTGNQILVVKQQESIHGCPGIIPPQHIDPIFIGVDTELKLGVLTGGLELNIEEGMIIFSTDKYVRKYGKLSEENWELKESPISLGWFEFMNLGKEVQGRTFSMPNNFSTNFQCGLRVHVGEEVEKYFRRESFAKVRPLDTSYVEALNLLKQEVPQDFRIAYDKKVYQKKVGMINKLEELTAEELKLKEAIGLVYGRVDKRPTLGGEVLYSTKPEFRGLDKDDAKIITFNQRERLESVRQSINNYLGQAINLGMHKEDLRIERKPGFEVNVPVYISGMCEKYGIKI